MFPALFRLQAWPERHAWCCLERVLAASSLKNTACCSSSDAPYIIEMPNVSAQRNIWRIIMRSKQSRLPICQRKSIIFLSLKLALAGPAGNKINDKDSGFPVKMCLQHTENAEIKTHFDEKWNYEHRLVLTEGCLTSKKKIKKELPSWALK